MTFSSDCLALGNVKVLKGVVDCIVDHDCIFTCCDPSTAVVIFELQISKSIGGAGKGGGVQEVGCYTTTCKLPISSLQKIF